MKTSALWLCVLLVSAALRGAPFEGRILMQRVEPPAPAHDIICSIKGDKIRVEVIRERVNTWITDTTKHETTAIMEDDMAYIVMASLEPLADTPKLEKTGEKTKIHGYDVEKYVMETDDGKTELWLAAGLTKYTGFGEGYEKPPPQEPNVDLPDPAMPWPWEYAIARQSLFPLRVITRDAGGNVIFQLEAKAITPAELSDRLFLPSPNYKKVDSWPETK
jgi:hypothetical protein